MKVMNKLRNILILSFVSVIYLVLFWQPDVAGLSCAPLPPLNHLEHMQEADVVFTGSVTHARTGDTSQNNVFSTAQNVYSIKVDDPIKGVGSNQIIEVITDQTWGSKLEKDKGYLVILSYTSGQLLEPLCEQTAFLPLNDRRVKEYEQYYNKIRTTVPTTPTPGKSTLPLMIIGPLAVTVVILLIFLVRRR